MPAPDEGRIVVVHVNAIAKAAEEASHGEASLIYAVTGYTTDKCRKIIHLHPLNGSIQVNVALAMPICVLLYSSTIHIIVTNSI